MMTTRAEQTTRGTPDSPISCENEGTIVTRGPTATVTRALQGKTQKRGKTPPQSLRDKEPTRRKPHNSGKRPRTAGEEHVTNAAAKSTARQNIRRGGANEQTTDRSD